jgi:nucleotide-binding universal stress UspA family protein
MPYTTDAEALPGSFAEMASRQMAADLKMHQTDKAKIKQAHRYGISTAPEILHYAKDNDVDLIVMGTHGRRGLGHLFLGSVAEEVVRMAHCSVLTIRERKEPLPVEAVERILVPVDFSEHSKRALAYAKELAAAYQTRLQLLHVVEEVIHPAFYRASGPSILALKPDLRTTVEHELRNFLKEIKGPEAAADFYVIEGRAAHAIVNFAESYHSDLVVISTHGLTGLVHMLHGSVTEKVVRTAPCPVLTVSALGKSLL